MTRSFTYNPASQIVNKTSSNTTYDWNPLAAFTDAYGANGLNQVTTVNGASLTYDAGGNLTNDGAKTYSYDASNRLKSATPNGGGAGVALSYDPSGRLFETVGTATTRFLYDGADIIGEYDGAGTLLRRYVHGPGIDEPLVQYDGAGTTSKKYLHADARGSIIALTDASGNVVAKNAYDPYGEPDAGNTGLFQYTGQIWLAEAGLYHYKARAYHPGLGRFLQTDPIGFAGGMNIYAYAGNDPVNATDPSGLCTGSRITDGSDHCAGWGGGTIAGTGYCSGKCGSASEDGGGTTTNRVEGEADLGILGGGGCKGNVCVVYSGAPLGLGSNGIANAIGTAGTISSVLPPVNEICFTCRGTPAAASDDDGSVVFESNELLRTLVPGQIAWDNAITAYLNGQLGDAALFTLGMFGEQVLTVATLGQGNRIQTVAQETSVLGGRFFGPAGPVFGDTAFGAAQQGFLNAGRIRIGFGRGGGFANFRLGIDNNKIILFRTPIPPK